MAGEKGRSGPLKRRVLVAILRRYGAEERPGKGSHRLLVRRHPTDPKRFLKTVLPFHGDSEDIQPSVIRSIRRKLELSPEHGVADATFFGDDA